jgi:endoglycosylceramidase
VGRWAAVLALVLMAGSARAQAPAPRLEYLHVAPGADLPQVVDESGRTVILRGVNVNGLVDYWTPDLRPNYPVAPKAYERGACPHDSSLTTAVPLCERDLSQIAAFGWDVIRLPLSWSLLEPTPGTINRTYVDRIAQVVGWARARGVRVVLDLHQDAWSKYVFAPKGALCPPQTVAMDGGDGAPAWASAHLTTACAPGGTRELEPPVQEAAQRFWLDLPASDGVGVQEHYAAVMTALARRFAREPAVAGYEVMNEPQPGFAPLVMDGTELMLFQAKVVNTVVAALPHLRQLFFVEPGGTRNVTAARTFVLPWSAYSSYRDVVYAPHVYTSVFTADSTVLQGKAGSLESSDSDYQAAVGDAKALGLPLWVGEFGNDPHDDRRILDPHYAHQDALAIGGALWVWKEHGTWGVLGAPYDGGGLSKGARTTRVATVYPSATVGVLDSFTSDPFTGKASFRAHSAASRIPTIIELPALFHGTLHVTGATYRVVGRTVLLYPRGGAYSLSTER